jgi:hypothetical protein
MESLQIYVGELLREERLIRMNTETQRQMLQPLLRDCSKLK